MEKLLCEMELCYKQLNYDFAKGASAGELKQLGAYGLKGEPTEYRVAV